MAITDQRRQRQAIAYGRKLRKALDETGTSVYRLARIVNPQAPESARSNIQRYLRGAVLPGPENRHELAAALERPELMYADDDEEESPAMSLDDFLRARIREIHREETDRSVTT